MAIWVYKINTILRVHKITGNILFYEKLFILYIWVPTHNYLQSSRNQIIMNFIKCYPISKGYINIYYIIIMTVVDEKKNNNIKLRESKSFVLSWSMTDSILLRVKIKSNNNEKSDEKKRRRNILFSFRYFS